jgi:flagellar biosynthesis anti-sigma factor FlgM
MSDHKGLFGHGMTKYVGETALNPLKQRNEKTFSQGNMLTELKPDTIVNFSDVSNHVQKAERDIDYDPDVRLEKVRAIRQEIQNGVYRVDYDKIADNLIGVFIDEISTDSAIPPNIFFVGCTGILS